MSGKVIVPIVSLILVVGVAIGVVAYVHVNNGSNSNGEVKNHNKAVTAICQGSDDKKLCHETLEPIKTDDPKDYIKAVVESTMKTVIASLNMTDKVSVDPAKPDAKGMKMAVDDCKDLLAAAMDELEASGVMVGEKDMSKVMEHEAELRNWLGAVIAYQQSCLDGFGKDEGEKAVQGQLQTGGLDNMGKLTALALDVVVGISQVLNAFGLDLNVKPVRRLLNEVDGEGYPTWFSNSERRLLTEAIKPNVVVAQDGSGQFKTVQEAVNSYPPKFNGRYVIYVKAGVYNEYVTITKKQPNIFMYGDGAAKTIITGNRSFHSGWKTMQSATFCTYIYI